MAYALNWDGVASQVLIRNELKPLDQVANEIGWKETSPRWLTIGAAEVPMHLRYFHNKKKRTIGRINEYTSMFADPAFVPWERTQKPKPMFNTKGKTLHSFAELQKEFFPTRKDKSKAPMPAMMVSVTTWIDSAALNTDTNTCMLTRIHGNKRKQRRVGLDTMKKYVKPNSEHSITVTGRRAINMVAIPLMQM